MIRLKRRAYPVRLWLFDGERKRESLEFLPAGNVRQGRGDEEVHDRSRNATTLRGDGRQMRRALYIDPSGKIGSSFSQEKRVTARMRRSTPPSLPRRCSSRSGRTGERNGSDESGGRMISSSLSLPLASSGISARAYYARMINRRARPPGISIRFPRLALTARHPRPSARLP